MVPGTQLRRSNRMLEAQEYRSQWNTVEAVKSPTDVTAEQLRELGAWLIDRGEAPGEVVDVYVARRLDGSIWVEDAETFESAYKLPGELLEEEEPPVLEGIPEESAPAVAPPPEAGYPRLAEVTDAEVDSALEELALDGGVE
jgi:hypothetical protein